MILFNKEVFTKCQKKKDQESQVKLAQSRWALQVSKDICSGSVPEGKYILKNEQTLI